MRIAYVEMAPEGHEIHVADSSAGMLVKGDVVELDGVSWEIQKIMPCRGQGVVSAIDHRPVDAVVTVRWVGAS